MRTGIHIDLRLDVPRLFQGLRVWFFPHQWRLKATTWYGIPRTLYVFFGPFEFWFAPYSGGRWDWKVRPSISVDVDLGKHTVSFRLHLWWRLEIELNRYRYKEHKPTYSLSLWCGPLWLYAYNVTERKEKS